MNAKELDVHDTHNTTYLFVDVMILAVRKHQSSAKETLIKSLFILKRYCQTLFFHEVSPIIDLLLSAIYKLFHGSNDTYVLKNFHLLYYSASPIISVVELLPDSSLYVS